MIRRLSQFLILGCIMLVVPIAAARLLYDPGPPRLFPLKRPGRTDALVVVRGRTVAEYEWRQTGFALLAKARLPFPVRMTSMIGVPADPETEPVLLAAHGGRAILCRFAGDGIRIERLDVPVGGLIHQAFSYSDRTENRYLVLRTVPLYPIRTGEFCVHRLRMRRTAEGGIRLERAGSGIAAKEMPARISRPDLDGDRRPEMVVTAPPEETWACEWRGDRLIRKWDVPLPEGSDDARYVDLDGDGRSEIVIARAAPKGKLLTVYEWSDGEFAHVGDSQPIDDVRLLSSVPGPFGAVVLSRVVDGGRGGGLWGWRLRGGELSHVWTVSDLPPDAPFACGEFTSRSRRAIACYRGGGLALHEWPQPQS